MMLVFNDYQSAYIANAVISLNMRLCGDITMQWAEIQEREDGKFVIPKPEDIIDGEKISPSPFMANVPEGYLVEEMPTGE
ncbi:hypothetical protein [Dehalobacter restrictus]|uniref:hypothetical protein n=1 Tax=Dehalobacter restrictus TaxID=55583 RepID=UPI00338E64A7